MNRLLITFAAATLVASAAPRQSDKQQSTSQSQQSTSQSQQSNVSNQRRQTSGSAERMQETTVTTDTKKTKITTDTIYGKVQAYQANKSIEITVPGRTESTRTIDLTGNNLTARVSPNVKVGDWVKLEQKTDDSGNKTIKVERSSQRAARMMSEEQGGQSGQQQGSAHRRK